MARGRARPRFDPYAILVALERERTTYILIGAFARVIHGTDEITRGLDLTHRQERRASVASMPLSRRFTPAAPTADRCHS